VTTLAITILTFISSLVGVSSTPSEDSAVWKTENKWKKNNNGYTFEATSKKIVSECIKNPDSYIFFPSIIHAAHSIFLDNKLIKSFGRHDFKSTRSFYGSPILSCKKVVEGNVLKWITTSYTSYFARIHKFPELVEKKPVNNLFFEILHAIAGGILLIMSIFCATLFSGKVSQKLSISLPLSCLFISMYFIFSVAGLFNIGLDMLTLHKLADFGIWFGLLFFFYALVQEKYCPKILFTIFASLVFVGCIFILIGNSGDVVQLGTTIPFGFTVFLMTYGIFISVTKLKDAQYKRKIILTTMSLVVFLTSAINEIFIVLGLYDGLTVFSIGMVSGLIFFALSVNEKIILTYRERDYLRKNLEIEVNNKTKELQIALKKQKETQAELVQSSKLASLGTLSAGIAHEINNSLACVSTGMRPLQRSIEKLEDHSQDEIIHGCLDSMKHGLNVTIDIIKSLSNYAGLNQARFKKVSIKTIIESVKTLLKHKIASNQIEIEIDIDTKHEIFGDVIGLNQIFMNLISNSIAAVNQKGRIKISTRQLNNSIEVELSDDGCGIPENIQDRIFDPFFTTKEVGSGTGLGLHIVKKEVNRHSGEISIKSEENKGTAFKISLPVNLTKDKYVAA